MVKQLIRKHRFLIKDWEWDAHVQTIIDSFVMGRDLRGYNNSWFSEGTVINMDYASLYSHLPIHGNPGEIYMAPPRTLESITVNLTVDSWEGLNDI